MWVIILVYQCDGTSLSSGDLMKNQIKSETNEIESNDMTLLETEVAARDSDESSGNFGLTGFNDDMDNLASKRSTEDKHHLKHPCSCPFRSKNIDLGRETFPRYHIEKSCDHNQIVQLNPRDPICKFGSKCSNVYHKVLLLKNRTPNFSPSGQQSLPTLIKDKYYWHTHELSIDCRCTF